MATSPERMHLQAGGADSSMQLLASHEKDTKNPPTEYEDKLSPMAGIEMAGTTPNSHPQTLSKRTASTTLFSVKMSPRPSEQLIPRNDPQTRTRKLHDTKTTLQTELEALRAACSAQTAAQQYKDEVDKRGMDPLQAKNGEKNLVFQPIPKRQRSKTRGRSRSEFSGSACADDVFVNEWRMERKRFCCFQWTTAA